MRTPQYISISHWGMFESPREYPLNVRHEPEVLKKQFEKGIFIAVYRGNIVDLES